MGRGRLEDFFNLGAGRSYRQNTELKMQGQTGPVYQMFGGSSDSKHVLHFLH